MKFLKTTIYGTLFTLLLSVSSYADCSYELFSISSTKNTKIIDFIDQLSDECEFTIIVSDPYAEKFLEKRLNKTHLKNLTIDEVLNIILEENNLSYSLENNILKISYLITKVFSIDYILSQRTSSGSTDVTLSSSSAANSTMGASSGSTTSSSGTQGVGSNAESGIKIESSDEVKFWEELDLEFQHILNRPHDTYKSGKPIINKNAGLVTVTATLSQVRRLENYLKDLQAKVQLQVLIDVQLLSVTMSEGKTTGIDWQQLYALQNMTIESNYGKENGKTTNMLSVQAGGTLKEVIKFLQSQGDVVSISNPKVLTLNNQPALITAGTEYFYKITSTETLASGTSGTQSENETVQSVFAGVLLDITPEIADDKTITLKINPSLSETRDDLSMQNSGDRNMPPDLTRRQLSSVVTVKDGNRIILGGLINTRKTKKSNKIPILGDIPGISYLFRYEEISKEVQELVIIIEPHIIDKDINNVSLSDLGYEGLKNNALNITSTSDNDNNTSEEAQEVNEEDER
ncbi:MAG: pilus (MSHA type) biogenesis protein MshL [Epsilonproteobacteria bacterium]|nr:MAG: pilus (MSHA type) biogenesis protein MshL [Campylobacterota bacterium]